MAIKLKYCEKSTMLIKLPRILGYISEPADNKMKPDTAVSSEWPKQTFTIEPPTKGAKTPAMFWHGHAFRRGQFTISNHIEKKKARHFQSHTQKARHFQCPWYNSKRLYIENSGASTRSFTPISSNAICHARLISNKKYINHFSRWLAKKSLGC